ncbi:Mu transposase domain-containing protein [Dactylosporangium darangshiense]|uniref:Transposase for insertion sequence element IS21-like C-terminal domain-containing protein n=2 Tax=Dactylosporangium darangshiense TaxID=579108 RepID=A0ABP8DTK4_9ACTN
MQAAAVRWCTDVAGQRARRPLDGAAPAAVFAAVEAGALQPLSARAFVLATWSTGQGRPGQPHQGGQALYSVPWRLIGQRLDARETWTTVLVFHNGQLVATHGRADNGKRTDMSHYPPEKIAFAMRTPAWCRRRVGEIGPAASAAIAALLEVGALFRLRSAQGVLGLADKHGREWLELACAKAIAAGDPSYRTIKGILGAGAETDPPPPPTGDGGASAHLHGPAALFGNVYPLPSRDGGEGDAPAEEVETLADVGEATRQRVPVIAERLRATVPSRMAAVGLADTCYPAWRAVLLRRRTLLGEGG